MVSMLSLANLLGLTKGGELQNFLSHDIDLILEVVVAAYCVVQAHLLIGEHVELVASLHLLLVEVLV
jgi:hypothetical protein